MERLNDFKVVSISTPKPNEYLLDCEINGKKRRVEVQVTMNEPIFGVNLPDKLILMLRDYPAQSRSLIETVRKFHQGAEIKFPLTILSDNSTSNLKAA